MRDFFINMFEKLVGVVVVLMEIGVVIGAVGAMAGAGQGPMGGGILAGLMILIFGTVYVLFIGGVLYLILGIYHNTRRTADATDRMAGQA
ncbi:MULTISPECIES: hypothetical protein [Sediminimonas]|uniref:hypothetical protein n=1 Tax=Sediminimonas TaxID=659427 RepID=UPI000428A164|nr:MULTISPECIES: hypothetical protein [Sediminimonas]MDR9484541.1 hypothetical protein [Sediminimonas sp.]